LPELRLCFDCVYQMSYVIVSFCMCTSWSAAATSCPQPVAWTSYNVTANLTNPVIWSPAIIPVCIASGSSSYELPVFGHLAINTYPMFCRISTPPNNIAYNDVYSFEVWNADMSYLTQSYPFIEALLTIGAKPGRRLQVWFTQLMICYVFVTFLFIHVICNFICDHECHFLCLAMLWKAAGPLAADQEAVWVPLAHVDLGINSIKNPNCAFTADHRNLAQMDPIKNSRFHSCRNRTFWITKYSLVWLRTWY
jgi:hypothetical protein